MTAVRLGLLALLAPLVLAAQTAAPAVYRGFGPGAPYREFAERARALARRDTLRCNTSRNTAQLMECGVIIRDPADSASFYLSAYVLEGKIAMVSLYDSGGTRLVEHAKRDMVRRFGPAQRTEISMWEWKSSPKIARLSWRGRGTMRWVSIILWDKNVMDGINRYVGRPR